jgi:hypothetical protein
MFHVCPFEAVEALVCHAVGKGASVELRELGARAVGIELGEGVDAKIESGSAERRPGSAIPASDIGVVHEVLPTRTQPRREGTGAILIETGEREKEAV